MASAALPATCQATEADDFPTVSATEVARRLNRNVASIHRWRHPGVKLPNGARLKLRMVREPGGWRLTWAWLREFFDTLTEAYSAVPAPAATRRSPAARQRANAQAERRLAELGIGAEPVGAETA